MDVIAKALYLVRVCGTSMATVFRHYGYLIVPAILLVVMVIVIGWYA